MKMKRSLSILVSFLALNLLSLPTHADFVVTETNQSTDVYGNAQTVEFRRAVSGSNGSFSAQEQEELSKLVPPKETGRYYGRARLNFSTLVLDAIKNRSVTTSVYNGGTVTTSRQTANQVGLEVAVGYIWSSNMRGEIEYLVNKNLTYNSKPFLTGGAGVPGQNLSATLQNNTLLANIYYEFSGLYRFRPYLTAGIGPSINNVQASLLPGTSQTTRKLGFAWAVGAGLRIGIFDNWYLDASYRYIRLGSGVNINPGSGARLISDYSLNAMSVGLIYLF